MGKVSARTALSGADVATNDLVDAVDVSATTAGSKYMTFSELLIGLPRLGFNPATIGIAKVNGTVQWNWGDGFIYPETDDDVDLGKTAQRFKDAYIDGIAYIDQIEGPATLPFSVGGTTQWNSEDGAISPETTNDVDLGKTDKLFKNLYVTNIDIGASGAAGTLDLFPGTATSGKLALSVTDQTGDTTVSVVIGAMAGARTITLRDPGAAASILTSTDGTAAATTSTAVELTRIADVSTRLVAVGGTSLAVTVAAHADRIILLDHSAAESTATLPAAAGTGAVFRFIVSAVNTNNHIITITGDDTMKGSVNILDNDAAAQGAFAATTTDNTITLNGTTTGGQIGDWIELVDIAADVWAVRGDLVVPAGSNPADPFSAV
jgi:hypothetical protein